MRLSSKLILGGLIYAVAVAAGSVAFAGPAAANPVSASPTAPPAPTAGTTVTLPGSDEPETSEQGSGGWTGGAARDMDSGDWRATVTRDGVTILLGHHDTEKEAKKAGRKKAKELNSQVMDGPGCDPPFVLC